MEEKRKVLVIRDVYESMRESCFDLFVEILSSLDLIATGRSKRELRTKVTVKINPMGITFPNGSRIIFKGLDSVEKVRSINGVSIMWIEEASEISYAKYLELTGRMRTPEESMHFILTCNPVGRDNWIYKHFFQTEDNEGNPILFMNEELFYQKRTIIRGKSGDPTSIYYHHSTPLDNPHLPEAYLKRLEALRNYDPYLYRVAMFGRFGVTGLRVLTQFEIATHNEAFAQKVRSIPIKRHFIGFDFGFEGSYNCVLSMAVDDATKTLYIYDEVYINNITDDKMAQLPQMQKIKARQKMWREKYEITRPIIADNEDPKAISYYRSQGFIIRKTFAKWNGSKLSNTRKVKRFHSIVCSMRCQSTIRELSNLTYKVDNRGNIKYDQFNIDAHSMSAIWYALDTVNVTDVKEYSNNSRAGTVDEITYKRENIFMEMTERQRRELGVRYKNQQQQFLQQNT